MQELLTEQMIYLQVLAQCLKLSLFRKSVGRFSISLFLYNFPFILPNKHDQYCTNNETYRRQAAIDIKVHGCISMFVSITVNPLYNNIRYNSKICYNVNLVCTKISRSCIFSFIFVFYSSGKRTFFIFVRIASQRRF